MLLDPFINPEMSVRFPDVPQSIETDETIRYGEFRTLVAIRGELTTPRCVAIDPNTNHIYVTEGTGEYINIWHRISYVKIFSEAGKYLNKFSHETMQSLCGIAIHKNHIYVTDMSTHSIFHFKVSAYISFVSRVGRMGSGKRQFNVPLQLTVSTNGDVFVADSSNDRIKILDSKLRYQRHISHPTMSWPRDVQLSLDEVFVLSYIDPCIHVFSYPGHKIRSLVTRSGIGMRISMPRHFCLDANGNFIISDGNDHRIKIFSKEGTLIHTLGQRGSNVGMFDGPCGVALINHSKLVVASSKNLYGLQIFSF